MSSLIKLCFLFVIPIFVLIKKKSSLKKDRRKALIETRRSFKSQKLSHGHYPLLVVRGEGCYLYDELGRRYLDTRNNVASIGHQNPVWVEKVSKQLALTNTNSRYLHPLRNQLEELICSTLPSHLSYCFFTNSGSEATELAIRLGKAKTKRSKILAVEQGYHGFTNAALEASPYKFQNGRKLPDNLVVVELGGNVENLPLNEVSCMIIESALSVGGVLFPPPNWLSSTFEIVKKHGGVCICDEIQVGLGRTGKWFWAFQRDPNCVPDIVTVGKGLGNGFPVGAVICTKEIADALDAENREVFSTFGGNPVACQAAICVLEQIQDNKLQENARIVGEYFKKSLIETIFSDKVTEVRGEGLFLGIELISAEITQNVVKCLYDKHSVLASIDGPNNNVITIKPPLCFKMKQVDEFIFALKDSLSYC